MAYRCGRASPVLSAAWQTLRSEPCMQGSPLKWPVPGVWRQSQTVYQALSEMEEEEEGELLP